MELDEILNKLYDSRLFFPDIYFPDSSLQKEHIAQTHSAILKWIKEKLPKEKNANDILNKSKAPILTEEFNRLKNEVNAWNTYRQQTLKNLGKEN